MAPGNTAWPTPKRYLGRGALLAVLLLVVWTSPSGWLGWFGTVAVTAAFVGLFVVDMWVDPWRARRTLAREGSASSPSDPRRP